MTKKAAFKLDLSALGVDTRPTYKQWIDSYESDEPLPFSMWKCLVDYCRNTQDESITDDHIKFGAYIYSKYVNPLIPVKSETPKQPESTTVLTSDEIQVLRNNLNSGIQPKVFTDDAPDDEAIAPVIEPIVEPVRFNDKSKFKKPNLHDEKTAKQPEKPRYEDKTVKHWRDWRIGADRD